MEFIVFLYLVANGAYALLAPRNWSRARWTTRRGLTADVPEVTARSVGVISLLASALFLYGGIRKFEVTSGAGISPVDRFAAQVLHYLIPAMWSCGALVLILGGIWALLSPEKWLAFTKALGTKQTTANPWALRLWGLAMALAGVALLGLELRRSIP